MATDASERKRGPWTTQARIYGTLLCLWVSLMLLAGGILFQARYTIAERAFSEKAERLAHDIDKTLSINVALLDAVSAILIVQGPEAAEPELLRSPLRRYPHVDGLLIYRNPLADDVENSYPLMLRAALRHDEMVPDGSDGMRHPVLGPALAVAASTKQVVASAPMAVGAGHPRYALVRVLSSPSWEVEASVLVTLVLYLPVADHAPDPVEEMPCPSQVRLVHESPPRMNREAVLFQYEGAGRRTGVASLFPTLERSQGFSADGQPFRMDCRCQLDWRMFDAAALAGFGLVSVSALLMALAYGRLRLSRLVSRDADRQRLFHLANFDTLTGLPNRNLMLDRLAQAISRARRSGQSLALLYLDVDGFKAVNDTAGHAAGDRVLAEIARRLRDAVREQDTVARLSGDEFVVLLEDLDQPELAAAAVDKVHDCMAEPFRVYDLTFLLGVSIGYAYFPADGETATELLHAADLAMYTVKHPENRR